MTIINMTGGKSDTVKGIQMDIVANGYNYTDTVTLVAKPYMPAFGNNYVLYGTSSTGSVSLKWVADNEVKSPTNDFYFSSTNVSYGLNTLRDGDDLYITTPVENTNNMYKLNLSTGVATKYDVFANYSIGYTSFLLTPTLAYVCRQHQTGYDSKPAYLYELVDGEWVQKKELSISSRKAKVLVKIQDKIIFYVEETTGNKLYAIDLEGNITSHETIRAFCVDGEDVYHIQGDGLYINDILAYSQDFSSGNIGIIASDGVAVIKQDSTCFVYSEGVLTESVMDFLPDVQSSYYTCHQKTFIGNTRLSDGTQTNLSTLFSLADTGKAFYFVDGKLAI